MNDDINPAIGSMLQSARDFLTHEHSLFKSLSLKPLLLGRGKATFSLSLREEFADANGTIHGGLATIVLDSIMGLTVFTSLETLKPIATINLRVDQVTEAQVNSRAVCACETQAITRDVAYVSARLTDEDSGGLIAIASGAFMVGTKGRIETGSATSPTLGSRL